MNENMISEKTVDFICERKNISHLHQNSFKLNNSIVTYVTLHNNKLSDIHDYQFKYLIDLIFIDLDNNLIKVISKKLFMENKKLEHIKLSYNKLSVFETDLNTLVKLRILTLDNNLLTKISKIIFESYFYKKQFNTYSKNSLSINNNKFEYGCHMSWIRNLSQKVELDIEIEPNPMCTHPDLDRVTITCYININNRAEGCHFIKDYDCKIS